MDRTPAATLMDVFESTHDMAQVQKAMDTMCILDLTQAVQVLSKLAEAAKSRRQKEYPGANYETLDVYFS